MIQPKLIKEAIKFYEDRLNEALAHPDNMVFCLGIQKMIDELASQQLYMAELAIYLSETEPLKLHFKIFQEKPKKGWDSIEIHKFIYQIILAHRAVGCILPTKILLQYGKPLTIEVGHLSTIKYASYDFMPVEEGAYEKFIQTFKDNQDNQEPNTSNEETIKRDY